MHGSRPLGPSRRRTAAALVVTGLVLVAVVVALVLTQSRNSAQPATGPATTCPSPATTPGFRVAEDYPGLVVWEGRTYLMTEQAGVPAQELGTVTCNLVEINDRTGAGVPTPWPNGTSSVAKAGAPIHAQQGADPGCAVTVQFEGAWRLFRAEGC